MKTVLRPTPASVAEMIHRYLLGDLEGLEDIMTLTRGVDDDLFLTVAHEPDLIRGVRSILRIHVTYESISG